MPHVHPCGGLAQCATCPLQVFDGLAHCLPRTPTKQQLAHRLHLPTDMRLACQTTAGLPPHLPTRYH